jgi:hypothetical protein
VPLEQFLCFEIILARGVKMSELQANKLPPPPTKDNNTWSYTSTSLSSWRDTQLIRHWDNVAFFTYETDILQMFQSIPLARLSRTSSTGFTAQCVPRSPVPAGSKPDKIGSGFTYKCISVQNLQHGLSRTTI